MRRSETGHATPRSDGPVAGLDHFALGVADLDRAAEALRAAGSVGFLSQPFQIGDLVTGVKGRFMAGPDGEKIELFERIGR